MQVMRALRGGASPTRQRQAASPARAVGEKRLLLFHALQALERLVDAVLAADKVGFGLHMATRRLRVLMHTSCRLSWDG